MFDILSNPKLDLDDNLILTMISIAGQQLITFRFNMHIIFSGLDDKH